MHFLQHQLEESINSSGKWVDRSAYMSATNETKLMLASVIMCKSDKKYHSYQQIHKAYTH